MGAEASRTMESDLLASMSRKSSAFRLSAHRLIPHHPKSPSNERPHRAKHRHKPKPLSRATSAVKDVHSNFMNARGAPVRMLPRRRRSFLSNSRTGSARGSTNSTMHSDISDSASQSWDEEDEEEEEEEWEWEAETEESRAPDASKRARPPMAPKPLRPAQSCRLLDPRHALPESHSAPLPLTSTQESGVPTTEASDDAPNSAPCKRSTMQSTEPPTCGDIHPTQRTHLEGNDLTLKGNCMNETSTVNGTSSSGGTHSTERVRQEGGGARHGNGETNERMEVPRRQRAMARGLFKTEKTVSFRRCSKRHSYENDGEEEKGETGRKEEGDARAEESEGSHSSRLMDTSTPQREFSPHDRAPHNAKSLSSSALTPSSRSQPVKLVNVLSVRALKDRVRAVISDSESCISSARGGSETSQSRGSSKSSRFSRSSSEFFMNWGYDDYMEVGESYSPSGPGRNASNAPTQSRSRRSDDQKRAEPNDAMMDSHPRQNRHNNNNNNNSTSEHRGNSYVAPTPPLSSNNNLSPRFRQFAQRQGDPQQQPKQQQQQQSSPTRLPYAEERNGEGRTELGFAIQPSSVGTTREEGTGNRSASSHHVLDGSPHGAPLPNPSDLLPTDNLFRGIMNLSFSDLSRGGVGADPSNNVDKQQQQQQQQQHMDIIVTATSVPSCEGDAQHTPHASRQSRPTRRRESPEAAMGPSVSFEDPISWRGVDGLPQFPQTWSATRRAQLAGFTHNFDTEPEGTFPVWSNASLARTPHTPRGLGTPQKTAVVGMGRGEFRPLACSKDKFWALMQRHIHASESTVEEQEEREDG